MITDLINSKNSKNCSCEILEGADAVCSSPCGATGVVWAVRIPVYYTHSKDLANCTNSIHGSKCGNHFPLHSTRVDIVLLLSSPSRKRSWRVPPATREALQTHRSKPSVMALTRVSVLQVAFLWPSSHTRWLPCFVNHPRVGHVRCSSDAHDISKFEDSLIACVSAYRSNCSIPRRSTLLC